MLTTAFSICENIPCISPPNPKLLSICSYIIMMMWCSACMIWLYCTLYWLELLLAFSIGKFQLLSLMSMVGRSSLPVLHDPTDLNFGSYTALSNSFLWLKQCDLSFWGRVGRRPSPQLEYSCNKYSNLIGQLEDLSVHLDPSCNKYCDPIGQEQVSYFPYKLVYKPVKNCCLRVGLLLGSSLYVKPMGIVARI